MEKSKFDRSEQKEENTRLSRFMANVSHDLKTPLNAVIGFSSLLLQEMKSMHADTSHQLGLIDKNARKLLGRLDAIVDFFRLRAGVVVPEMEWLTTREFVLKVTEKYEEMANRQNNTLHVDKESMPARIRSSQDLLNRVLSELVANAVKYTTGGKIEVCADIQPGSQADALRVCFSVVDSGGSLSPEILTKLSESLGWVSSDDWQMRRNVFEGLGLGLALAREAANLLDGWIEVEAGSNQAGKFSLVLQLAKQDIEP